MNSRKDGKGSTHIPVRTCIVCRRKISQKLLLRMVIADGKIMWDNKKLCQGRGAYVCPAGRCIKQVQANYRQCLDRAFRKKVHRSTGDVTDISIELSCLGD